MDRYSAASTRFFFPPAPRQHRLQERPGITALLPHDLLRRPRSHDLAAAVAAFGAEVDDPVGGFTPLYSTVSTPKASRGQRNRYTVALNVS
jgi:hypothetical protein